MLKRILTTTAMTILLPASIVLAQSQPTMAPKTEPSAQSAPTLAPSPDAAPAMKVESAPKSTAMAPAGDNANKSVFYSTTANQSDQMMSNYLNHTVYSATDQNLGSITDILVNSDGKAVAAIIGVGGFLGIGEKNIAISFDSLQWKTKNGSKYITLNVTKDQLKSATAFNKPTKSM